MALKEKLPWWVKVSAKLALARLPIAYKTWNKLGVFVHGKMANPAYAFSVFERHFQFAKPKEGFASLELGPGDSLFSAILSKAFGGSKSTLIDVGAFARQDVQPYFELAAYLTERGFKIPEISSAATVLEILSKCDSSYLTDGLQSLKKVPTASIDLIWSQAVLEHVRREEFIDQIKETRRIIKPGGVCTHEIDLRDHFERNLHNLRFSPERWESPLFRDSGFYTNRLRYPELISIFENAGFKVELLEAIRWPELPLPREKLDASFRHFTDDELKVSSFTVKLTPV